MMTINIILKGEPACGKTRATKALQAALTAYLADKDYQVSWTHILPDGGVSETGGFGHRAEGSNNT